MWRIIRLLATIYLIFLPAALLFGILDYWNFPTGIGTSGTTVILAVAASSSSSFTGRGGTKNYLAGGFWEQPFAKPYFENSTKPDVSTTVGQTAYLHCRVRNLGDRAVSWIRKRDLHILTVGVLTYTGDQRFQSLHSDGTDEWTLKISSTQMRDSGTYECQVSTEPKISMAFHLSVVVSQAEILGNSELHLKSDSDINLTCIVRQTPEPPTYIYWYHGRRVINYSQRGGINVVTEKQTRTSRLLISKAQPNDSGNYTCAPSNSESASALVHVLNGENPAAMQHGNNSAVPLIQLSLRINIFNNIQSVVLIASLVVFHTLVNVNLLDLSLTSMISIKKSNKSTCQRTR